MLAPASTMFSTEWRPLDGLAGIADAWRDLCDRAAEPNVFYEPAFALAAAPVLGRDAGAVLVWSPEGRLAGLFPASVVRHRYGLPLPLLVAWTHAYGPLGTPLVDRDRITEVVAAFLDHVATAPRLPRLVLMPELAADGVVARALGEEALRRGGRVRDFEPRRRALLATADDAATYLSATMSKRRRHELNRKRHKLVATGALVSTFETSPERVDATFADFLALERSGWKGRAGTAAALDDDVAAFMARAVAGLAQEGKVIAACLRHAGRPIAATVALRSGCGAWLWKIAYDEAEAQSSPGVQITLDATAHLIGEPSIAFTDSCAAPDHPMIDRLWRERLALVDRLIVAAPGHASFALACRLEELRRRGVAMAKRLRDRVRGS